MTQEDKQLLLKDLSARLPYNVIINCEGPGIKYKCFLTTDILNEILLDLEYYDYEPYLRPMSSMTKEEYGQYMEFIEWSHNDYDGTVTTCINKERLHEYMDFIYSHHLDDNNLIVKGLALEAPERMYKTE